MSLATKCLKRCRRCGAQLGLSILARRYDWCPKCQALLQPEKFLLGPRPGVIVKDEIRSHPQPLAKVVGILAYSALASGSDRMVLTCQNGEYALAAEFNEKQIAVKPPPSHLSKYLPDVVRAVAGIPLAIDDCVTGDVTIIEPDASPQEWLMQVAIAYFDEGHRISFEFASDREVNLEMLAILPEAAAQES
jgi:hypothetical protein